MSNGIAAEEHFTYKRPTAENLQQGDVLKKTPEIQEVLKDIHPYYKTKDDYTHFIVLTQSCDLVLRDGIPKSRYITIAAVRPIRIAIERELAKYQDDFSKKAKVCRTNVRDRMHQFIQQLLNNNLSEYFYLHPAVLSDFPDRSCAFLRLSVSIQSREHYKKCVNARLLSLDPVFQAKLGWLVGQIYSRVGTEDWVPAAVKTDAEFDQAVNDILDETCKWMDEKQLRKARNTAPEGLMEQGLEAIRNHIHSTPVPKRRELIIGSVIEEIKKMDKIANDDEAQRLEKGLLSNEIFKKYTKE